MATVSDVAMTTIAIEADKRKAMLLDHFKTLPNLLITAQQVKIYQRHLLFCDLFYQQQCGSIHRWLGDGKTIHPQGMQNS